ncbi:MAG: hypothetical protein ACRDPR_07905 [Nocardioidaceae bacterium]
MGALNTISSRLRGLRGRATAVVAATGAVALVAGFIVLGTVETAQGATRNINICHRTDNDKHPYTYQRVSPNSTQLEGHLDHRTLNGGGEDKFWDNDGVWNGIPHEAGDFKPDYIEGLDPIVPIGNAAGRAFCLAQTVDILVEPEITFTDPCGTENDTVDGVAKEGYTFEVDEETGVVTFTAAEGFVFADEETTATLTAAWTDVPCPRQATPVEPAVEASDECEVEGSYTVPETEGVEYLLDGEDLAPGTYSGPESGLITAEPVGDVLLTDPDFEFALDLDPAEECDILGEESEPPEEPDEVLGTATAVPTAVDAGIGGPTGSAGSTTGLLGQGLVGLGLMLLALGAMMQIGRPRRGAHQI